MFCQEGSGACQHPNENVKTSIQEITMESKIVTQRDADEQQTQRTPSPSPSVATTQYATPYASTSIMRIPTMNNNWYMNDDHF